MWRIWPPGNRVRSLESKGFTASPLVFKLHKKRFSASLKLTSRICLLLNRVKDILKGLKGPTSLKTPFFLVRLYISFITFTEKVFCDHCDQ